MLPVPDIRQVHEWFLHRGLPLVLTRRVRSRALIERSAPMVSGVGAVISLTMMLAELTDGDPDFGWRPRLTTASVRVCSATHRAGLLKRAHSGPRERYVRDYVRQRDRADRRPTLGHADLSETVDSSLSLSSLRPAAPTELSTSVRKMYAYNGVSAYRHARSRSDS